MDDLMPDAETRKLKRSCPSCDTSLKVSPKLFGKKFKCSKCGSVLEFDRESGQLSLEPAEAELIKKKRMKLAPNPSQYRRLYVLLFVFVAVFTLGPVVMGLWSLFSYKSEARMVREAYLLKLASSEDTLLFDIKIRRAEIEQYRRKVSDIKSRVPMLQARRDKLTELEKSLDEYEDLFKSIEKGLKGSESDEETDAVVEEFLEVSLRFKERDFLTELRKIETP